MATNRFLVSVQKLTGAWNILWRTATTLLPVLAVMLTVFSAAATHKHDRLSVTPKLSFEWNTGRDNLIGLFVENSGAGPAIIKNFWIDNDDLLRSAQIFAEPPVVRRLLRTYFFQNASKEGLVTIEADKVKDVDAFRQLIEGKLLVTIEYCSIYGDCWKECSKIADPTCGLRNSPAEDILNVGFLSNIL